MVNCDLCGEVCRRNKQGLLCCLQNDQCCKEMDREQKFREGKVLKRWEMVDIYPVAAIASVGPADSQTMWSGASLESLHGNPGLSRTHITRMMKNTKRLIHHEAFISNKSVLRNCWRAQGHCYSAMVRTLGSVIAVTQIGIRASAA